MNVSTAQPIAPRICAFLQDLAGVPGETRERAKHQAALVFERSALDFVWTNDGHPFSANCVAVRMTANPPQGYDRDRAVLGAVWLSKGSRARLARVYYERIRARSSITRLDEAVLLGHVIAHEIGHLLLLDDQHTLSGVMRDGWDRAQVENAAAGLLRFTPRQVLRIARQWGEAGPIR